MAQSIKMPALGESVTEGTVSAWLKNVGDTVEADEPIVEVATDKVDSEVPSPISGVLLEILVQEDDTVEVGTEIARVGSPDEAGSGDSGTSAPAPVAEPESETATEPSAVEDAPASGSDGDITEVTMPALGESVTEGTVSAWLKEVGDKVDADEPIVEVATDKVDSEVPSPVEGYLVEVLADEDDTVEVGTVIARISSSPAGSTSATPAKVEAAPAPAAVPAPAPAAKQTPPVAPPSTPPAHMAPRPPAPPAPPVPPAPPAPVAPPAAPSPEPHQSEALTKAASSGTVVPDAPGTPAAAGYVTPIVRKFAKDKGIDLTTVTGTGIGGRIRKEDVVAAAEAAAAATVESATTPPVEVGVSGKIEISPEAAAMRGTTEKMPRLRQTIARRMVESLQTSAQLTTVFEVDVTRIWNLRAKYKAQFEQVHGTRLTFLPFFVKAATEALAAHPKLNATINGNQVEYFDHENVGIAVDAPKGLMVPVIKNAGDMSIAQIAESINTLAADVRNGTVGPDQLTGSTFTVTNTGSGGALFDTPVLNMPETGIMGVGAIVKRPVVVKDGDGGEAVAIRSMVYLSITYDHRLVDGADASRFLTSVKNRLEEGNFLPDLQLA